MRVTTWNINSVRARLHLLGDWLDDRRPDVLCLQELKCRDEDFPAAVFEERGYNLAVFGQKSYNGVAIASLHPIDAVVRGLPVDDGEARGLAATTGGLRVVNVYVVNGREVGHEQYHRKLAWLGALRDWLDADATPGDDLVLCGDFNIAPADADVHDPELWRDRVLCSEPERARFRELLDWGLTDAWRHLHPDASGRYAHTWWDYRGRGFQRGLGLRIDHHLVTAPVLARTRGVTIDREARKAARPSDHAPVHLDLDP